eukprot:sb/3464125/
MLIIIASRSESCITCEEVNHRPCGSGACSGPREREREKSKERESEREKYIEEEEGEGEVHNSPTSRMSSYCGEELQTIVLDIGAHTTKIGYAGEDDNVQEVPTLVGKPLNPELPDYGSKSYFVGRQAMTNRGILKLTRPIVGGVIQDYDDFEEIVRCAMTNELRADPSVTSVLLTDKMYSPKKQREKIAEILFGVFDIEGYYVGLQTLLPMYHKDSETTTALIVDIGHDVTEVTPIHEGFVLIHQARRSGISGRTIDDKLSELMSEVTVSGSRRMLSDTPNEREIITDLKEKLCKVKCYPDDLVTIAKYTLPDGSQIVLDEEVYNAPEALFNPFLVGSSAIGLSQLIFDTVMGCPIDTRRELFGNILLIGGTSQLDQLPDRLDNDLGKLVPSSVEINLVIPEEPQTCTWHGGSSFAGLHQFAEKLFTRQMYAEYGPAIVGKEGARVYCTPSHSSSGCKGTKQILSHTPDKTLWMGLGGCVWIELSRDHTISMKHI